MTEKGISFLTKQTKCKCNEDWSLKRPALGRVKWPSDPSQREKVFMDQLTSMAYTLEVRVLLSALLHFFVGLMKTIGQMCSIVLKSGPLFLAIAWLMFFQFRFADPGSVLSGLPCAAFASVGVLFRSPLVEGGFGVLLPPLLSCEYCFQSAVSASCSQEISAGCSPLASLQSGHSASSRLQRCATSSCVQIL